MAYQLKNNALEPHLPLQKYAAETGLWIEVN
jgi:hypothetical protein